MNAKSGLYRSRALESLKLLRGRIDTLIHGIEEGDLWFAHAIDGSLVDLLFNARDDILMLELEEENE